MTLCPWVMRSRHFSRTYCHLLQGSTGLRPPRPDTFQNDIALYPTRTKSSNTPLCKAHNLWLVLCSYVMQNLTPNRHASISALPPSYAMLQINKINFTNSLIQWISYSICPLHTEKLSMAAHNQHTRILQASIKKKLLIILSRAHWMAS
jgi:hypothetical protein